MKEDPVNLDIIKQHEKQINDLKEVNNQRSWELQNKTNQCIAYKIFRKWLERLFFFKTTNYTRKKNDTHQQKQTNLQTIISQNDQK